MNYSNLQRALGILCTIMVTITLDLFGLRIGSMTHSILQRALGIDVYWHLYLYITVSVTLIGTCVVVCT
jgi:hypothetical protein